MIKKVLQSQLRDKVRGISNSAIDMLSKSLSGEVPADPSMMDKLIRIVSQGIKVEHMDQLKEQNDRSFGLRLLQYLPREGDARREYIAMSNPSLRPLLENKPKK